jgi:leucine dehydrogenase
VEAAIRACCEHRYGSATLSGRAVTVIGLGHVGLPLAERLGAAGAELLVSDIDPAKRADAERLGADWVEPQSAIGAECDVLAPCALGGVINSDNIGDLGCEIVCGSANNVLAGNALASELAERGVLYAPDFIANAGGLINVYGELHALGRERLDELVDGIGRAIGSILDAAEERSITPLEAAREVARERLEAAAPGPGAIPTAAP